MDLIRPLGLAGIPCALAARPGALPVHSRFVRASFPWVDPVRIPTASPTPWRRSPRRRTSRPSSSTRATGTCWRSRATASGSARAARFTLPDAELVEDLRRQGALPAPRAPARPARPARRRRRGRPPTRPATSGLALPARRQAADAQHATWQARGRRRQGASRSRRADDLEALWALLAQARRRRCCVQELVPGPGDRDRELPRLRRRERRGGRASSRAARSARPRRASAIQHRARDHGGARRPRRSAARCVERLGLRGSGQARLQARARRRPAPARDQPALQPLAPRRARWRASTCRRSSTPT